MDLKLDNIFLDENFNIRLGDFGSAIFCESKNFKTNLRWGSPGFMAPEIEQN